jgi:hypothetical protein
MKSINNHIHIEKIGRDMLPELANHNHKRQKNKEFMRFIKERPQTKNQNLRQLEKLFDRHKASLFAILTQEGNIIGSVVTN